MYLFPAVLALQVTEAQGTLLTIFVGIIAVCVLGITLGLLGVVIALLRAKSLATRKFNEEMQKAKPGIAAVRAKVEPLLANATELLRDMTPKMKSVVDDAAELSHLVRAQLTDLDSTLSEVTSKARSQVDRVNGMVSSTLDTTTDVVSSLERGIRVPIREVSGLVAGLRAGLDVLTSRSTRPIVHDRGIPQHLNREVHRAAEQAQAAADLRAQEGREALRAHQPVSPVNTTPARSVSAVEEIVAPEGKRSILDR